MVLEFILLRLNNRQRKASGSICSSSWRQSCLTEGAVVDTLQAGTGRKTTSLSPACDESQVSFHLFLHKNLVNMQKHITFAASKHQ
jgi:hypothetical protein